MRILEVNSVSKKLGKREIVKDISFDIEEGEIFGFLGPNGAGKTTTIRMLVGLISPDKGNILIMGKDVQKNRVEALRKAGVIVENPDLYGDLSGRENLIAFAKMYGNISKEKIEEVIEQVGLKDRIDDKVKKYSLGMKQRLGLGQAILCDPKLLILDEPTNGLDPIGIMEFRNIVKKLAKENGTAVFISSHILAEIQQVCDKVAFIDGGEIKAVEEVNGFNAVKFETIILVTNETNKCEELIRNLTYVHEVKKEKEKLTIMIDKGFSPKLAAYLVKNGIDIEEMYKKHMILEERFMEITQGGKVACGD